MMWMMLLLIDDNGDPDDVDNSDADDDCHDDSDTDDMNDIADDDVDYGWSGDDGDFLAPLLCTTCADELALKNVLVTLLFTVAKLHTTIELQSLDDDNCGHAFIPNSHWYWAFHTLRRGSILDVILAFGMHPGTPPE